MTKPSGTKPDDRRAKTFGCDSLPSGPIDFPALSSDPRQAVPFYSQASPTPLALASA